MCSHKHTICTVYLLLPINKDPCSLHSTGEAESSQPLIYILPSYLNGQIIGGNITVLRSPVKIPAVPHLEALARKAVMFNDTHAIDTALAHSACLLLRCSSLCMDESASGRMFCEVSVTALAGITVESAALAERLLALYSPMPMFGDW